MKRKYLYRKPDPRNKERVRVYFRHPKTAQLTALPNDETSAEFAAQYDALLAALTKAPKPARDPNVRVKRNRDDGNVLYRPGMLGWFIEKFLPRIISIPPASRPMPRAPATTIASTLIC